MDGRCQNIRDLIENKVEKLSWRKTSQGDLFASVSNHSVFLSEKNQGEVILTVKNRHGELIFDTGVKGETYRKAWEVYVNYETTLEEITQTLKGL